MRKQVPTFNVLVLPGLRIHTCPKVASNSITRAAGKYGYGMPEDQGDEFRFMAVRHPLERLVSVWQYFCCEGMGRLTDQMQELGYYWSMEFSEFLEVALVYYDYNNHTRMQVTYHGPYHMDMLCPLELLSVAWKQLREQFDYLAAIDHVNGSDHASWLDYYTVQQKEIAEDVFHLDVLLYKQACKNWLDNSKSTE